METAIFGLIGVIVGALLTIAKDLWFDHRKRQKDITYLATHVVCIFDRFVAGCISVTRDDGLSCGQRDKDGCKVPQVEHPTIDFASLEVEWKSLPPKLMYEVLNFQSLIDDAEAHISIVSEFDAGPPDYEEYFESSTIKYAELGLAAIDISNKLRGLGKLPKSLENGEGFNRKELLTKAKAEMAAGYRPCGNCRL